MKRKYLNPINLCKRIVFELLHPQNFYLKRIKKYLINFLKKNNSKKKYDFFYAIYDLEVSAVTFNFVEFLVMCNDHLLINNYKYFIVVFIEKDQKSINSGEFDFKFDASNQKWRLYEILIPLIKFCKNCKGHFFIPNRALFFKHIKNLDTYPEDYSISNIASIGLDELKKLYKKNNIERCSLSSNITHIKFIENWLKVNELNKDKTVVISIRDTSFDTVRNSKLSEWIKFTNFLLDRKYQVVIIPDNDSTIDYFSKFNNCKIAYEAAYSVSFRFVLSEIVYVNLYVSHGPSLLSVFNMKSDYAIFNMQPKDHSFTDTFEVYEQVGLEYGNDYKFAKKKQKLIWEEDTFENLKKYFIKYFLN